MCKVLIIPKLNKDKAELNEKFVKTMAPLMSKSNSDGLGYVGLDSDLKIFGERWLVNSQAFSAKPTKKSIAGLFGGLATGVVEQQAYNKFGNAQLKDAVSIMLHTRYATSAKGFDNCHPFVEGETAMIHNGVIDNHDKWKLLSTNDSEAILRAYLQHNVADNIKDGIDMALDLVGYYVSGIYSMTSKGVRVLDILKGNNDNLHAVWINELNTYVMSTSEYDIKSACDTLGFTYGEFTKFKDGIMMRMDVTTGEMVDHIEFTPNARYVYKPQTYNTTWNTNVIDVSSKANNSKKSKSNALTTSMIDYLKLKPKVEKLSYFTDYAYGFGGGYSDY